MPADLPFSPEEFKEIYSRVPRLCIDLIVRAPGGVVLTLRALPTWHNQWHFPGGGVLYGETIEKAIQRVALRELGVGVAVRKLLGYMEFPSEQKERGFGWSVSLGFLCEVQNTDFALTNNEASDIRIFSELPVNIVEEHRAFLQAHTEWQH